MSAQPPPATLDHAAVKDVALAIRKKIMRLKRRLVAIARDVERADAGRELQRRAELLIHSKLPGRGVSEIEVVDYACDPPQTIVVALDTALSPRSQVELWFKAARRYLRGAELGRERAIATRQEISALEAALLIVDDAEPAADDVARLLTDPRMSRFLRVAKAHERPQSVVGARRPQSVVGARRSFREFVGHGGARILVGRGARDNDELTTRIARSQDLFLHAHETTGAHVIIPRSKGEQVPTELLLDAAHLAHHFSGLAGDSRSDVNYTERRYVQKRRGAPPGSVQLLRSKVLHLVVDPARLTRLIASEVRSA